MKNHIFDLQVHGKTIFQQDDSSIWLNRLYGMLCGNGGSGTGPERASGLAVVTTDQGHYEGGSFKLQKVSSNDEHLAITWLAAENTLRIESKWFFDKSSGVISRKDRLVNVSPSPVTLARYHERFAFCMLNPEVYSQRSVWNHENQGSWTLLTHGTLELANERGRTTCGGTPFAALREKDSQHGIAFHILPVGNWMIKVYAYAIQQSQPYALVELGQSDVNLRIVLQPGESYDSPEVLLHNLPDGEAHSGTSNLHAYLLKKVFVDTKMEPAMLYNTWFYQFDRLDGPSLRKQLKAAKEIGCEVFEIDAGWFGPQGGGWWQQVGDWREKTDASFFGKMAEFADEVRAAGMGFGLWMEPERFAPLAPIIQEHPDWFFHGDREHRRIDLENPQAYAWIKSEIYRLVETYKLAWMKVDFNFELGSDPARRELSGYYLCLYRLLDELRASFPGTFFEGCASGGMRSDINTLAHFDDHFLSDTVNPVDVLRIVQGAWLRLPPGRISSWVVVRAAGKDIPWYKDSMGDEWPTTIVTPQGAGWELTESVDLAFAAAVTLRGLIGVSGDIASLPESALIELSKTVAFYKRWRKFICGSVGYLLTPPQPKEDRSGWVGMQLQEPAGTLSLVYVYRLYDWRSVQVFRPQNLNGSATYRVQREDVVEEPIRMRGDELMSKGLEVKLMQNYHSAIYSITPE